MRYLMNTGELVDVIGVRYYETPAGDVPRCLLRLAQSCVIETSESRDDGPAIRGSTLLRAGQIYALTLTELKRNGRLVDEDATEVRRAA